MFGSSNDKESLQKKYNQLMEESYKLSHSNRKKSDMKRGEAEEIGKLSRRARERVEQVGLEEGKLLSPFRRFECSRIQPSENSARDRHSA